MMKALRFVVLFIVLVVPAGTPSTSGPDMNEGREHLAAERRIQSTLEQCESEVRLHPESAEAYYNLGEAYCLRWYMKSQAIAAFKEALRLNPAYVEANNRLGWLALNAESPFCGLVRYRDDVDGCKDAVQQFTTAIRSNPTFSEAYLGLGLALHCLARYAEATDAYRQAIRLEPDYSAAYGELSYAYELLGRFEEAIEAREQKIRIDSNKETKVDKDLKIGRFSPTTDETFADQIALGDLYVQLRWYQRAIDFYKRAIEIEPRDAIGHHRLGLSYSLLGDRESALDQHRILMDLGRERVQRLNYRPDPEYQHFAEDLLNRLEK